MATKLKTIQVVEYRDLMRSSGSVKSLRQEDTILRLGAVGDLLELKRTLTGSNFKGIIPSYEANNWELNATSALMVKNALRGHRIVAPIPTDSMKKIREMLGTYAAGGMTAFAIPELVGGTPVQNKAGFWMMSGVLQDNYWYHVMGGKGVEIPADVPGTWTWSEAEL